jgi:Holliday junction DNA helicase RuvB
MINIERAVQPTVTANDENFDPALRPKSLQDFVGQSALKQNLEVFIAGAKKRGEPLDHVLFYGPPGLGKTTLSNIIASELNVGFKITSGPMLSKTGDLAAILTSLQERDVLFIDEIHRLHASVEEVLYSAMEDFAIDLIIGEGPSAKTVKINLSKFTLLGATTRLGLLSNPLRDRFGIPMKLDFYSSEELKLVILRATKILGFNITDEALELLSRCARGTPRIAVRLLKRIRDFASYNNQTTIDIVIAGEGLAALGIDMLGLDSFDKKYLQYIAVNYKGGPVGIETIAAGLSEDRDTIEDTVEPFLLQIGFIARTPRGRTLTQVAYDHLGWEFFGR